jgi:Taurine catabolism dioxygenase TauD, TfdA family
MIAAIHGRDTILTKENAAMSLIWTKPITGPKAWRGEDLAGDNSWIVTLSDAEIADLDRALAAARATGRPLAGVERAHFPLTVMRQRLEHTLDATRDGRGFVLIRGLPVNRYSDEDVGLIFWGLGRYLGSPLYQNPQGDLLGHVYDHGRSYGNIDVRGYETSAYLPYHTDAGDLVGLLCLRRAREGGLSSIVSSVTVHNEILAHHPEYLGLLYSGFYYIRREAALTERGVSDRPIPVFGEKDGVVSCRYIRNQINAGAVKRGVALTAVERAALDYLDEQTRRPDLRLDMDLQPGDIQLINNYTILHSRTEFVDGPEPHEKRHMLRLWLKFPVPWPIAPGFPEHLGYKPDQDTPVLAEAEA